MATQSPAASSGAVPGHPALRALMDRLLEYQTIPQTLSARHTTGPLLYSLTFETRDDIVVLPREVFYPYNPYIGIMPFKPVASPFGVCASLGRDLGDTIERSATQTFRTPGTSTG